MTQYPIDMLRLSTDSAPGSIDVSMVEPEQFDEEQGDGKLWPLSCKGAPIYLLW